MNVPPPDFCSILQNLRFGVFTLLPEYPLRYCRMTETVGGGAHGGGGDYGSIGVGTVEKPRRMKSKTTAGIKTRGGGGTWEPIPSREVDVTLLCRAENGDRVRVKSMFALVGVPPTLCASDGLATCWAYHLQGGVNFELQPQVGPLSLRGGRHLPEEGIRRADLGETLTGRGRSGIG